MNTNVKSKLELLRKYGIILVMVALIVLFSLLSDVFLTYNNLMNILRQVSMIGIASVGGMFVMLLGGIDLSQGALVSFVNIVAAWMMVHAGLPWGLVIVINLIAGAVAGYINGILVTVTNIPALIATLATQNVLFGLAYIICGGQSIAGFPQIFKVIGQGYLGPVPIPVILMVIFFVIGGFILNRTYFGRSLYAIGGNEEAAKLSGINVDRIKRLVYLISGLFTSVSAIVTLSRVNSGQANTGDGFEFDVITAIVLGGISVNGGSGKLYNAIIGVLIIGILNNGLVLINMSQYVQMIVKGIILALAVAFDCVPKKSKG